MGTSLGSANESTYGPAFGKGDVVGIGVNTIARCVFFTLNGEQLPLAVELPLGTEAVYPTYNFGTRGFRWGGGEDARAGQGQKREFVGFVMDVLPVYSG
ncbi:hypothetical protein BCR44DRAFT_1423938 [Catenaria anguillulae PL171]|uniref:B30.2/SPRY domain-containing protein n=1 Tax=Catenaria anguillulae PL171 TaxID=765915 RepID=A0A1Y2I1X3_9FUNG|nr:hypothetical protein BCR44DRAFT_1423938 [Catenaria anguillulae PL171]